MRYPTSSGAFAIIILLLASNISQSREPTNYEVFCAQVDTLAQSAMKALTSQDVKLVYLKFGSRDVEVLVHQRIVEALLKNSFHVSMTDSSAVPSLRVAVPLVGVSYSAPVASHIFGSSDVVRTIRSAYDVEIADRGQIRFAKSYTFVFSDTVKENQISTLESGSYSFLRGKIVSGSFLDTMLQPLLFVASAAVVVYLFFTLRGS
ncbi:MAG: hypothetical protein M1469_02425 [Bacteroidetes bacterium]|nr:hypothetical protein [Bacteroidota bacterium]